MGTCTENTQVHDIRDFPGFEHLSFFYGRFGVGEAFQWIPSAILIHPEVPRLQEQFSRPISGVCF